MRSTTALLVLSMVCVTLFTSSSELFNPDGSPDPGATGIDEDQLHRVSVNTATTGADIPASDYRYTVVLTPVGSTGGARSASVGINQQGANTWSEVAGGNYTLELTDVPENCQVQGTNPISIVVGVLNSNEFYNFAIECVPHVGSIRLFNDTNGDPMVEAYMVTIDAGDPIELRPDFNVVVDDVAVGDHTLTITGIPNHCLLIGATERTAAVFFGEQTSVDYFIDCTGENGLLRVTTSTTGTSQDPDGYLVNVGSETIGFSNNFSFDFGPLPMGDHEVFLYNVAPNCTVSGAEVVEADLFRKIGSVLANETVEVVFDIDCSTTGSLEVTTTTEGDLSHGGYTVLADGMEYEIGVNDVQLIPGLPVGDQQVTLTEIPEDCTVDTPNPRTLTIELGAVTQTSFQVTCPVTIPDVLFESDRDGDFEIYAMNPDGTGVMKLTDNAFADEDPSWSWDNQKIVFRSTRGGQPDIWVMNADGTDPKPITNNAADNEDPAFSPDGTQIVYEEEDPDDGTLEIFIANADGQDPVQLTDAAGMSEAPSFKPDGSLILFKSDRDGDFEVFTMDPAGDDEKPLTNTSVDDFDPSWSPDGTQIVFSSQRAQPTREDLWIMNADGSGQMRILNNSVWDWHPVFSTNGDQIIFTSDRDGDYELFRMNADGTGLLQLTNNGSRDDDAEYKKPIF